ncbi:hypothetical protein DB347_17465 [Opitutaceae bacterium EW11]|nr:hypothetical protein DB347_17465 [Opitutaceae bacterium EW11]
MRPLHPRIYTHLVTLWLALSLGGIVLGIVVWQRLNQSLDASLRGASFRIALQGAYRSLTDAESAARAYYLDGDSAELDAFHAAQSQFPGRFDDLADLAGTHPELQRDLMELRSTADLYLKVLDDNVALRGKSGRDALLPEKSQGLADAKDLANRLRSIVARLEQNPQDLLATHSTAARFELQRALSTTLAAGLFGLGAGVLAFYLSRVALRQEKQQRELSEHALRAERAAQDKSTFLANMSHEIRTPMNAILGFGELLVSELPAGSRSRQHARSIYDSAQSLLQLINDILDLSKIEASMLELHLDPSDVREVTSFLQTVFAQQAARKSLKLEFFVDPNLPHALLVDRSRLRQVLVNLVGNAIKFTQKGGVAVRILWELNPETRNSGTLKFQVTDTGVGIPAEKQVQIFEPFVQVDTRRPFEQQGTGLGLSIVLRLIERMGGTVRVESEVGMGSTFTVALPDVSISARLPASTHPSADEVVDFDDLAPAEILVVDDNAVNRNLLASTFEGTRHGVRFATNGREAVESVRGGRPDIVLMDIRMPEMDGQTALTEIRKLPGAELLPVIAVTASSIVDDEHRLRGTFAGYLRKPFTRAMLFREMAAFLPRRGSAAAPAASGRTMANDKPAKGRPERWPALLPVLRKIERTQWPGVNESGAIPEVKEFAERLAELGESRDCPPLSEYALTLLADAESYSVHRLEERLSKFPALIQEIERLVGAQPAATA